MFKKIAVGAGLVSVAGLSQAAGMDVSPITTAIADAITSVTSIGSAILLVYVAIKGFAFVKSALGR